MSSEKRKCSDCGTLLSSDDRFCGNCGKPVSSESSSQGDFSDKDIMGFVESDIAFHEPMSPEQLDREIQMMDDDQEAAVGESRGDLKPLEKKPRKDTPPPPDLLQVKTRDLNVVVDYTDKVNFSLIHNDFPLISRIRIRNMADEDADNGLVTCRIAPEEYGESWQQTFPLIPQGKTLDFESINVPIRLTRLKEIREAEKAFLKIQVEIDSEICFSETYPVELLAYNEWFFHPNVLQLLASFVKPNDPAVEKIINLAREHLRRLTAGDDAFAGYQIGGPKKVRCMIESIYLAMQKDLDISYINPPASFERTGQKVVTPAQILENRRGTCLDLALLYCACLERVGLNPLIFVIKGHAFMGCIMSKNTFKTSVIRKHRSILKLVKKNQVLPLNSTTFTSDDMDFRACQEEGSHFLLNGEFICAVDVKQARNEGIKPLP